LSINSGAVLLRKSQSDKKNLTADLSGFFFINMGGLIKSRWKYSLLCTREAMPPHKAKSNSNNTYHEQYNALSALDAFMRDKILCVWILHALQLKNMDP
jgi:hypothetical protein